MSRRSKALARERKVAAAQAQQPREQVQVRQLRARFDSAQTSDENRKHWGMADGLSADSAASPAVRRILRNRGRYETANNCYARGMVNALAMETIGTGPRLQLTGLPREDAKFVEAEFAAWSKAIDLPEKLRTMRMARATDGEAFAIFTNNTALPTRVKLDLRLIEAEQVTSTDIARTDPQSIDGIHFDAQGNPVSYDILRQHPGSNAVAYGQSDPVPASQVIHLFVPERPGQRRGIPELTPALPLFAQLRRWTLSVLAAAETAADFAAIMKSTDAPDGEETAAADAFERIEFERRAMITLPYGWDVTQLKAEHPTSTYGEVKREIVGEAARALNMTFNIAAGNSSGYNYSSGRLDYQVFAKVKKVDRSRTSTLALDPIFEAWRREAILIEGYFPQKLRLEKTNWAHSWFFDGDEAVDPEKSANAQGTRLANQMTTLADEWGEAGGDWEEKLEQLYIEAKKKIELAKKHGVTLADPNGTGPTALASTEPGKEGIDEEATGAPAGKGAAPAQKAAAKSGDVQQTALNGAQVTALVQIMAEVASGALPVEAAIVLVQLSFPLFDQAQVRKMVESALQGKPKPAPAPSPAPGAVAPQPEPETADA